MNASDYFTIEKAIHWLDRHAHEQPSLKSLSKAIDLSPSHLQRLFSRWAGISPKRFLQILTVYRAKALLEQQQPVLETALDVGLSSPGRLHDHMVALEALSPGEHKMGGLGLTIRYGIHDTPFGTCLLATTERGICHLAFCDPDKTKQAILTLHQAWPQAKLQQNTTSTQQLCAELFTPTPSLQPLHVLVKGTNFQLQVWKALLRIPAGSTTTYQSLAQQIGKPTSSRAVGNAVGQNSIAYLIPCHRVIRKTGVIHQYRWGATRKKTMLAWEAMKFHDHDNF